MLIRRLIRPLFAAVLVLASAACVRAADPAFVGKLALITDPEVARELNLSDDTKAKLLDIINKREQEAVGMVAKLKGLAPAKQAEQLAPFVAESEKLGVALLDDNQVKKLDKLRIAKEGMFGVLNPDLAGKLQITPDQQKQIADLLQKYKTSSASATSDIQKRAARSMYDKRIAGLLTDAQRGSWEQFSGVPAGGGSASGGGAPAPGATADAQNAGPGGVNVQKAGTTQLQVGEDGRFNGLKFEFTPWKNVLEYFARQGGYSFATDIYPSGTLNYTDPRSFTAEQVIDILNLHLMTKGFMLVKREKLLRLFDVDSNGPVPPEFVPECSPDELADRGEFELLTCKFQLSRWTPSEAETEIKKLVGRYGTIIVLGPARQVVVTDLGGKLRSIKKTIDAVEQPDAPKDENVSIVRLKRLTPTEFMGMLRPLLGIPDNMWATADNPPSLRLAINELDGIVICNGKTQMIEKVQKLAMTLDGDLATRASASGGIPVLEQDQFASYQVVSADPVHIDKVLRTLLANKFPSLRIELDQLSGKISVWGPLSAHRSIQAIINEMEQNGNVTELVHLRRLDPQTAMQSINQIFGGDPTGRTSTGSLRVSADPLNMSITLSGPPGKVDQAKGWLAQNGEMGGTGPAANQYVGPNGERSGTRVIPLSNRTIKAILSQAQTMFGDRGVIRVEDTTVNAPSTPAAAEPAATPATAPKSEPKSKAKPTKKEFTRTTKNSIYVVSLTDEESVGTTSQSGDETADEAAGEASEEQAPALQTAPQQPAGQSSDRAASPSDAPASQPLMPEITIKITPGGMIISSDDLDALDEFQGMLEELVEADERRGKRTETFPLKHKEAEVAANMLKAMIDGGANVGDTGLGSLASGLLGGGGLMGALLGGGSASSGSVSVTGSTGTGMLITPDVALNVLYVTAMPRELDNVDALIDLIDKPESSDPPVGMQPRFIPVKHAKAADVKTIVSEQFAEQIYDGNNNRGSRGGRGGPDPAQLLMAAMGGRGGRGGPGGGGLLGRQQQNMGEKPKMMISVATETNSLVVTAPEHLFKQVEAFVAVLDQEFEQPDASVAVVVLKRTNADVAHQQLAAIAGENAKITRILPTNQNSLAGNRNNQNNQNRTSNSSQGRSSSNQLSPEALARMRSFNQGGNNGFSGRGGPPQFFQGGPPGGFGGFGGNRGGGPTGFGGSSRGGPSSFGGSSRGSSSRGGPSSSFGGSSRGSSGRRGN